MSEATQTNEEKQKKKDIQKLKDLIKEKSDEALKCWEADDLESADKHLKEIIDLSDSQFELEENPDSKVQIIVSIIKFTHEKAQVYLDASDTQNA